jgi:hypothetical protein
MDSLRNCTHSRERQGEIMRTGVPREEGENELQERERCRGKRTTILTQEGGICRECLFGSTTPTTPTTPETPKWASTALHIWAKQDFTHGLDKHSNVVVEMNIV